MLLDFIATFFSSANTLLPFIATDVLHTDAIGYGWLSAAQSIGAVVVALFMAQATACANRGNYCYGEWAPLEWPRLSLDFHAITPSPCWP
jgi:hypothetical protein